MSNPFDFNEEYKKGNLWGSEPSRLLEIALKYVSKGTVLDIGAGQGRSTLPLARKGFDVTCIDTAQTGIEQILSVARAEGLSINAVTGDIRKFPMQEYDLILAESSLPFIPEARDVIERMKRATRVNGLNVVDVFTRDNPITFAYMFDQGELESCYAGWRIIKYKELKGPPHKDGDGPVHQHAVALLVAQKQEGQK